MTDPEEPKERPRASVETAALSDHRGHLLLGHHRPERHGLPAWDLIGLSWSFFSFELLLQVEEEAFLLKKALA